jgi:hypothetical protein
VDEDPFEKLMLLTNEVSEDQVGVDWASEEAPNLDVVPLKLVLYMYLRIFPYTSNVLMSVSSILIGC